MWVDGLRNYWTNNVHLGNFLGFLGLFVELLLRFATIRAWLGGLNSCLTHNAHLWCKCLKFGCIAWKESNFNVAL